MASFARDVLTYKYYRDTSGGMKDKAEELLKEEKKKNANKIHYFMSASKNLPGKFLLSYLPKTRCKHESFTVTPYGYRFRQQMFDSLAALLKWFKEHFRDPIPGNTPTLTPRTGGQTNGSASSRTPYGGTPGGASVSSGMSSEAIHRVAQNIPNHMLHSLSQAASQTPHYPHTPGGYGSQSAYINTPYTPSGQTPFMTPYSTPHTSATPRYGSSTPSPASSGQFAHPGAPVNTGRSGGYHTGGHPSQSPYGRHHPSPRMAPSPSQRGYAAQENADWQQAADSWAMPRAGSKSRDGSITPRDGRNTPRGHHATQRTPRYEDPVRKTPQFDDGRPSSRASRDYNYGKSPRSVRSTPRTNTSPHSMMTGDSTPLYDEN